MCRYQNRGVLVVDSSKKLEIIKKAIANKKPLKCDAGAKVNDKFDLSLWK